MGLKLKNIKSQYQKLASTLIDVKSDKNMTYELFSEVYVSERVKIFLSGNVESQEIELQVDILLPTLSSQDSNISKRNHKMGLLLGTYLGHLEYLLRLHEDNGFKLDIIIEEGIWFGTKKLEAEPTEKLISQLLPPKISPEQFSDCDFKNK